MKSFVALLLLVIAANAHSAANEPAEPARGPHPVFPMLLATGLLTWGAYELGSDAEEGQDNVALLWGGAALAAVSLTVWKRIKDSRETKLELGLAANQAPQLVLQYEFGG